MSKTLARLSALLVLCLAGIGLKAQVHSTEQIEVELVAETTTAVPGETLWLGIRLDPIENWHTYWKFGGDSGEATGTSDWQLPAGMSEDDIGDIVWPIPEWTPFLDSGLVTFTYGHEVFLPLPVSIPGDFQGDTLAAETTIDWQVCEVICIPGSARFAISLPVSNSPAIDERWRNGFADARANTPVPLGEHELTAQFNRHDGKVSVMVQAPDTRFADVDEAWFFPTRARVMKYAPYRDVMLEDSRIRITTEQHNRHPADMTELDGMLAWVDEEGAWHGYDLRPTLTSVAWDHSIEVELIAETSNIVPGETAWLGLRLDPAEHWHTYWKMGGDSGEPTSLNEWIAPTGTQVGELQFPAPAWLPFYDTDLVNFGYEEQVLHPVAVTIPADYEGESVELSTLAYWNVCDLICIPGEQRLSVTLPVGEALETDAAHAELFAGAREQLPVVEHDIRSLLAVAGERVSLGFESSTLNFDGIADAWFFPEQRRVIKPGPLRDVTVESNLLQITHQQPRRMLDDLESIYGTLVLEDAAGGRTAYDFVNPAGIANATTLASMAADAGGNDSGLGGLPLFMLGALLGGMILNLMPCVFPVLSLKALSFVAASGETARHQRNEGLAYTGGILISFVLLASVLIALRAAGEQVGWAFQFQQPWFPAFIVYLFFTLGLSLSGVFEIGTGLMGAGNSLTTQKGYKGSFFTGVLATIVATPCTAPFMGPALGFALTQPWVVAMLVFLSLGFGMALPILVLSFAPALTRFLPRPGAWMNTFKQFMAFPLYASAAFFLWVLGNQVGVMGMSLVLGVCILLALSAWLYQRRHVVGPIMRTANLAVGVATLFLAGYLMQTPFLQTMAQPDSDLALGSREHASADFEAFSSVRLAEYRAGGTPVFVNMTADWCITCLVNEQSSLGTERVKQSMEDNDIVYMKGDWTNEDPEITAVLEEFRRPSVPLYVLYPGDPAGEPVILPQILTPAILDDAFSAI
ncbi:MAG: hypothetical protein F4Y22_06315 [Gammaproteobacteria bacterium]|nr:hypothetical protein [Gammaproteobacteria bacterium]MYH46745.1 hypothetical protein [Gammaproteobacteria bacterium]MYL14002.1 hypothetical protein [Gammaproteobacteria bacterium]